VPRRKKNNSNNFFNHIDKKISFEEIPLKTMKVTIHALRWVFLLIFLFISAGIFALLVTGGEENVQMIVSYSITGFFTFFMGYFGWMFAQSIMELIAGNKEKGEAGISYYVRKKTKFKF
jgi:hypothetical protein